MNFLKRFHVKERTHLVKDLFIEHILTKQSLIAIGASLVFSFYIVQISAPQFSISSTLREALPSQASSSQSTLLGDAILGGSFASSSSTIEAFESNMYSYALAQRMWQKGWGSKVFGNGDMNPDYFNNISKNHKISDKIASFLSGYKLYDFYTAHDLQQYIISTFEIKQKRGSSNIDIFALKSDKDLAIKFMNDLIIETDNYSKESLIQRSKEIIEATYKQLAISKNSSISSALGNTINSEYYKIANLENDLPYHIYVTDPPHSSEYPITPDISSIIFSNLIAFLFLSMLFSFIHKNKEDLW